MSTISPFAAGTYTAMANASRAADMRSQFDRLALQLTTGKVSDSYAGLGIERRTSLDARAKIASLAGYDQAIDRSGTRVKVASASLTQIATNVTATKTQLTTGINGVGRDTLVASVRERLASVVDALNQTVDGRALFAGRATDVTPVETVDHILDGDPTKGLAGVSTLVAERKAADLGAGTPKTGRLALSATGTTIGLAESATASVRANFGFTIKAATSSNATAITAGATAGTASTAALTLAAQPAEGDVVRVAVNNADGSQSLVDLVAMANPPPGSTTAFAIGANATATGANLTALVSGKAVASAQSATPPGVSLALSGGTAGSASLAVNAQPSAGDTVTVTLGLRDGTTTTLTLTAAATGTTAGTFAIGANAAATAANLQAALGTALDSAATGPLAASSSVLAAQDFFAGSGAAGLAPRRIGGSSPFTGATGFSSASSTTTVTWYKGETSSDPRGTALVPLSAGQAARVGATADEPALRGVLASLSAMAGESFGTSAADDARFAALSERVQASLTPPDGAQTVADISNDFSRASASMSTAKTDHKAATAMLEDAIDGVEGVDTATVAQSLVDLQTRLQASYQTTAMLSKLSLVNFL